MTDFSYIKNGETLAIRGEVCTGCRACLDVCPHGVLEMVSGKAAIGARERCMECGACARNCPSGAISVSVGVRCAAAIIAGKLTGRAPSCGCGPESSCC